MEDDPQAAAPPQDSKPVKIGSVQIGSEEYDVAMNGRAVFAREGKDLYGRPAAHEVPLDAVAGCTLGDVSRELIQNLLNLLASTMKERDALAKRLHQTEE